MTYLAKKTKLERLMNLYIDFLPYCENKAQRFKLLDHIQELKYSIEKIERMPAQYSTPYRYNTLWNSEMNFENVILKIA